MAANQSNQPIEFIESDNPIEIVRYGLVKDSGGPGKYRGGMAITREWRLLADEAVFTIRSDRRRHQPYGLVGGASGTPSFNILNPGKDQKILPVLPRESTDLRKGESICHTQPGAGGYGDPLERDPAVVLEDVLDDKFGLDYVKREYGVVIDTATMTVDAPATRRLRKRKAAAGRRRQGPASHVAHFVRSLGLGLAEIGVSRPSSKRRP